MCLVIWVGRGVFCSLCKRQTKNSKSSRITNVLLHANVGLFVPHGRNSHKFTSLLQRTVPVSGRQYCVTVCLSSQALKGTRAAGVLCKFESPTLITWSCGGNLMRSPLVSPCQCSQTKWLKGLASRQNNSLSFLRDRSHSMVKSTATEHASLRLTWTDQIEFSL